MANQEHLDILRQGVKVWKQWRNEHPHVELDLSDANLRGTHLNGVDLRRADLHGALLHGADLGGVNLSDANLGEAGLVGTLLHSTNLSGANLGGTDLRSAILRNTILHSANLSGAKMWFTIITHVDFCGTKGLIEIRHEGPSILQLHTIQLPHDGSALPFLRGAGIPDEYVDLWRNTAMHPIQYHSVFISYSSHDEFLARRLHADFQDQGVRCWFAPEDLKIGDKIRARIDEAIHLQDKLLLLLSEHSLASAWVEDEVEAALEKEQRQQRDVLFPVRLDVSVMQTRAAWAAKLRRTRHIGDFTSWTDPQTYQQAFEWLLHDLKVDEE